MTSFTNFISSLTKLERVFYYPPASKASREVAKLTERKICIPLYMVSKNLSVCLSICYKLWPQLSQDWQKRMGKKNLGHLWQKEMSQKVAGRIRAKGQNSNFNKKIATHTCTIHNGGWGVGVRNLPHKFHLYLIFTTTNLKHVFNISYFLRY